MRYIDLTYLNSIAKGNMEFMEKMIRTFISQAEEDLVKLSNSIQEENFEQVYFIIHKFKPSINLLGINAVKDTTLIIEKYSKEKINLDLLPGLVDEFKGIINTTIGELKEELVNFKHRV